MTNKEQIQRDITIAFDFVEQIIDNPDLLDKIPEPCVMPHAPRRTPVREAKPTFQSAVDNRPSLLPDYNCNVSSSMLKKEIYRQ